jgi:hypothetical protein
MMLMTPRKELAPQSTPPGPVTISRPLDHLERLHPRDGGDVEHAVEHRDAVAQEQRRLEDAARIDRGELVELAP